MRKKETSKAQWDEVRAWGVLNGYTHLAAGAGTAAEHPLQAVTWYDVVKWCNAKSEMENLTPCYYTDAAQTMIYKREDFLTAKAHAKGREGIVFLLKKVGRDRRARRLGSGREDCRGF